VAQHLAQPLALRSVRKTASGDGIEDDPGAGPAIDLEGRFDRAIERSAFKHMALPNLVQTKTFHGRYSTHTRRN
jgi:hypothetical protein